MERGKKKVKKQSDCLFIFLCLCVFQMTCPSKAATLAVLMMQPLCPSASGSFFPISPTARRITLKVPAMFTCRKHTKKSEKLRLVFLLLLYVSASVCPSYVDNTLEVLQAVGDVLLKVVGFDGDSDAGTINCQVQLSELLPGQGHR